LAAPADEDCSLGTLRGVEQFGGVGRVDGRHSGHVIFEGAAVLLGMVDPIPPGPYVH